MPNDNEMMSKYAVDEDPRHTKTAAGEVGCPICGKTCERHGSVLLCPTHGSKGFERD